MVTVKLTGRQKNETKVVSYGTDDSIQDIIVNNFDITLKECKNIYLGSKSCDAMIEVQTNLIIDTVKSVLEDQQIVVMLKDPPLNAFEMMMQANNSVLKIEKVNERTGKEKIHNRLVDYLTENHIVFTRKNEIFKNTWFNTMKSVIWLLDYQTHKFSDLPNCPSLPGYFFQTTYRKLTHNGNKKKKAPDNLSCKDLCSAAMKLDHLLNMKADKNSNWNKMISDVAMLKNAINFYIAFLITSNNTMTENTATNTIQEDMKCTEENINN